MCPLPIGRIHITTVQSLIEIAEPPKKDVKMLLVFGRSQFVDKNVYGKIVDTIPQRRLI
jgi:hypothetical protein